jgi:hypothetical protein
VHGHGSNYASAKNSKSGITKKKTTVHTAGIFLYRMNIKPNFSKNSFQNFDVVKLSNLKQFY